VFQTLIEIAAVVVAIFVLEEVRSGAIPYGCAVETKQSCLSQFAPPSENLVLSCEVSRAQCFRALGPLNETSTITDYGFPADFNSTFLYCKCLIRSIIYNGQVAPGFCTFSNIFPLLVFALGTVVVAISELFLPRKVTIFVIYLSAVFYFVLSYIIIASLGWGSQPICQGIHYTNFVEVFLALVIANVVLFTVILVIVLLGAAKMMPKNWIEYNPKKLLAKKEQTKEQRQQFRQTMQLNGVSRRSVQSMLRKSGDLSKERDDLGSSQRLRKQSGTSGNNNNEDDDIPVPMISMSKTTGVLENDAESE
jgi:hypothetical protein